jgi:DeoR family transcriptional regulator, fructose operon transcriptional repressor
MTQELRIKYILNHLVKVESITIQDIVEKCNVSEITARRDLNTLEERGLLIRTHGGAIKSEVPNGMFVFDKNLIQNRDNKIDICRFAAGFVEENDTIYIDCGTTTYYLSRFLTKFRNLRIITNSLPVVSELLPFPHIKVYLIGGELDNSRKALYGQMTDTLISRYKADKAFIGAGGVSLTHGLSSMDEKDASVTVKMAEAAQKVFLLCDSSKIEKDSYFTYSSISMLSYLITDNNVDPKLVDLFRNSKINIVTPGT